VASTGLVLLLRSPLFRLIRTARHLDMQKIRKIDISFKIVHIGSSKFGCYYLQYVPAPKLFDHA
jgi:hypothetical protein